MQNYMEQDSMMDKLEEEICSWCGSFKECYYDDAEDEYICKDCIEYEITRLNKILKKNRSSD